MAIEFLPCGDTGLTVQFGASIDRELSRRIMSFRSVVDEACLPGIIETVPTYRSLTVHYDPMQTSRADLIEKLSPLVERAGVAKIQDMTHWRFPVCFDNDKFAPDLGTVATWAGMSAGQVVDIITSVPLYVYMIGFAPGQPYLGDLPDSLAIPRRENPVKSVPKGSLVTATGLAVLYPVANPTGWHVIGRSPIPIYDVSWEKPVLLTPGDTISIYPVSRNEYDSIETKLRTGTYRIERVASS